MAKRASKKSVKSQVQISDPQEELAEEVLRELTQAEIFYIDQKYGVDSVEEIAKVLGVELSQVVSHIPKKAQSRMQGLMGKKPRFGTTVMTPAASEMADDIKAQSKSPKVGKHIYKPYGDE